MLAPIYVNYPGKTFEIFGFKSDKDHFFSFPKRKPLTNMEKLSIGIGTLAGTAIPMMQFCKKQKVAKHSQFNLSSQFSLGFPIN